MFLFLVVLNIFWILLFVVIPNKKLYFLYFFIVESFDVFLAVVWNTLKHRKLIESISCCKVFLLIDLRHLLQSLIIFLYSLLILLHCFFLKNEVMTTFFLIVWVRIQSNRQSFNPFPSMSVSLMSLAGLPVHLAFSGVVLSCPEQPGSVNHTFLCYF